MDYGLYLKFKIQGRLLEDLKQALDKICTPLEDH